MPFHFAAAAFALLFFPARIPPDPGPLTMTEPIYLPAGLAPTTSGPWLLTWDDAVDGAMHDQPHTLMLALRFVGDRVAGEFVAAERSALLTGSTVGLDFDTPLLRLRQDEPGYTCIYDAQRTEFGWSGTWRDTKGRAGDCRLQPVVRIDFGTKPFTVDFDPFRPHFRAPGPSIPHAEIKLPKFEIELQKFEIEERR